MRVVLLGHRREPDLEFERDGIQWVTRSLIPFGPGSYFRAINKFCSRGRPDWIIGCSDLWYGILAFRASGRFGARSLIDAYDNFESYIPWARPAHRVWRQALSRADVVSAAGPDLGEYLARGRPRRDFLLLPMAADPEFAPLADREAARRALGLPQDVPLVGYCGSLHPNRGPETLFGSMAEVRRRNPAARLVLSGRVLRGLAPPGDAINLGYVEDDKMPRLVGSLDVLTVLNRDSKFGRFSHPAKLYEAMRCGIPIAATRTPATEWILSDHPEMLAAPDDPAALGQAIVRGLERSIPPSFSAVNSWDTSARKLDEALYSDR